MKGFYLNDLIGKYVHQKQELEKQIENNDFSDYDMGKYATINKFVKDLFKLSDELKKEEKQKQLEKRSKGLLD